MSPIFEIWRKSLPDLVQSLLALCKPYSLHIEMYCKNVENCKGLLSCLSIEVNSDDKEDWQFYTNFSKKITYAHQVIKFLSFCTGTLFIESWAILNALKARQIHGSPTFLIMDPFSPKMLSEYMLTLCHSSLLTYLFSFTVKFHHSNRIFWLVIYLLFVVLFPVTSTNNVNFILLSKFPDELISISSEILKDAITLFIRFIRNSFSNMNR